MADKTIEMPKWFDEKKHLHTGRGVYERETGWGLAEDGLPISVMERARRLAAAGKKNDPLGHASEELIAAETLALKRAEALAAEERAAAEQAANPPAAEAQAAIPARKDK